VTEQAGERHDGLLQLARPELYRRNLFRVLSLPVTATAADVRRRQKRLEMERKLGVAQAAASGGPLTLAPAPTEAESRVALERLTDPEARLLDELFWFWPLNGAADPALRALEQGQLEEARAAWGREAEAGGRGGVARHNLAVLDHLLVLDRELLPAGVDGVGDLWLRALASWDAVSRSDGFWERVRERIRELDDARLTGGTLRRLRATLPRAVLGINAALAFQAGARKDAATARRHVDLLRAADRDGLADEVLRASLEPLRRQIKAVVEDARARWKEAPHHGDRVVRELHERATALLATVDAVLPEADAARIGLHDLVSEAISDGAWAFANKTNAWSEGVPLVKLARAVAASATQRAKQDGEIGTLEGNAKNGNDFCAPGYWDLPAETRDQLEAIRARAQAGDWDGALRALGALDAAIGKPLRRAAAHCVAVNAIQVFNRAFAEFRQAKQELPITRGFLAKLRGMSSGALSVLLRRPNSSLPSHMNPPCACCGALGYSSWFNFELQGLPVFWCSACNERQERELGGPTATLRKHLAFAVERIQVAALIDPDDPGIVREVKNIPETAASWDVPIPNQDAALARCRALLPNLAAPIEARIEQARKAERDAAQARAAAEKARAAEAARRSRGRRRVFLLVAAAVLAVVAWRGWLLYVEFTPFATVQTSDQALSGLWGSGANDVWAAGDGVVLHWDGRSWTRADFGQALVPALRAVWGSAREDVWAVGDKGALFHWNGAQWAAPEGGAGTSEGLQGVGGSAPDDVWAVGDHGAILHWDGKGWSDAPSPTYRNLHGVQAFAADDAWAVGEAGILRWDGEAWAIAANGGGELRAVWGSAPDDVWFVGDAGRFLHWDGRTLTSDQHATVQARAISGTGRGDVWVVGSGGEILRWDGARWSALPGAEYRPRLVAAWSAGGDAVWALGGRGAILGKRPERRAGGEPAAPAAPAVQPAAEGRPPVAARPRDAPWTSTTMRTGAGKPITGLWGTGPSDVWAAGGDGALRWNGKAWSPVPVGKGGGLSVIRGNAPNDAWALGPPEVGGIWRWNGTAWRAIPTEAKDLRGLWVRPRGDVWAVGKQGKVVRWNGERWKRSDLARFVDLTALWASPSGELWAVGQDGITARTPGGAWAITPESGGSAASLLGVWGSAPGDVWAVGQAGTTLHWDGSSWLVVPTGTDLPLNAVWGSARDEVFAVGGRGAVLRWNGQAWRPIRSGTQQPLQAVWGDGKGTVWVAGDGGTIVRLQRSAASGDGGKAR
jgi:hypothetical protein